MLAMLQGVVTKINIMPILFSLVFLHCGGSWSGTLSVVLERGQ